ncbi:MAG: hypothetical protein ABJM26_14395 [Anderseniella sp.]
MSDSSALDTIDGLDYEEIEQAVMETSRGRWFLTEFARRHKAADTAVLLGAIRRLESQIQSMSADAPDSPDADHPQGHADLPPAEAQAADNGDEVADYDEIADKLDRTTQLVRRLRSSHKLIGDAADKPLTAPKSVSMKSTPAVPAGDPPGFVGSDDDIFADNNSIASALQQQADAAKTGPGADSADASPANGDTLNFTDLDEVDDTAQSDAVDANDDGAADQSEQLTEAGPAPSQFKKMPVPPSADAEKTNPNGRISLSSPTAANQVHAANGTAAVPEQPAPNPEAPDTSAATIEEEQAEKPKKRIIVIRRPADHPGDIPLADSANDLPGDSPSAA